MQKEHVPGRGGSGACSGPDMSTYYLRHWFTRYGISRCLHIVLRYDQAKKARPQGRVLANPELINSLGDNNVIFLNVEILVFDLSSFMAFQIKYQLMQIDRPSFLRA